MGEPAGNHRLYPEVDFTALIEGRTTASRWNFGDGVVISMDNWQEWRCNTDPTSRTSFLHFTTSVSEGTAFVMRWQSAEGVRYRLNRSTNLITDDFSYLVRTNIVATPSINTETDKTAVGCGPWFYRVEVE